MKILIGTYTKSQSQGIYQMTLEDNALTSLTCIAHAENPTYLDFDPTSQTLFSVYQRDDQGGIALWRYEDNRATLIETHLEPGSTPCYVAYNPEEKQIYDANYHKGRVQIYQDDRLFRRIEYGEGSHAHFINRDPKSDAVFVCDLGLDRVLKYDLLNEIALYTTPKGSGPRHIAFHPTLPLLYVFTELSNEIIVLRDDGFELVELERISTLPEGIEKSSGAAVRISNDGKYLYASNRGHDSITQFALSDDGTALTWIDNISTFGEHPRDFVLTPDNLHLICANRDSHSLTLYKRDPISGKLTVIQKDIYAPEPVCVHVIGA